MAWACGPRSTARGAATITRAFGNDLSLIGNIVVIGVVHGLLFTAAGRLPSMHPASIDPAHWWM